MRDFRCIPALGLVLALTILLAACSDGVSVAPGDSALSASDAPGSPAVSINDPLNTFNEPMARPFIASAISTEARCDDLQQSASVAYATDAFQRLQDDDGSEYLLATRPASREVPEYIEFCVNVETLARYRIKTVTRAPSELEDSFFVTVDEEAAGQNANPGIYDVSRSAASFKEDQVRTREHNPLEVTLGAGPHTVRFYFREPNTALQQIRLEAQANSDIVLDPDDPAVTPLAQCAANTGLDEASVESLLQQYLGDVPRVFILRPFEINTGYTQRDDWRWDVDGGRGNIMCLTQPAEGRTNLVDNTVTDGRIVIGSPGRDQLFKATALVGTFIGNGGDDSIAVIRGGTFIGGPGDDSVELIESGRFVGGSGDDQAGTLVTGVFAGDDGDDTLAIMRSGEFAGGAGNDVLDNQFNGLFDGGPGQDQVVTQAQGSQTIDVEIGGSAFDMLLPPLDVQLITATAPGRSLAQPVTVALRWTASPDARTQGYQLETGVTSDSDVQSLVVSQIDGFTTARTSGVVRYDFQSASNASIRAYTQLPDGNFLLSEAVTVDFTLPDDEERLEQQQILASVDIDETGISEAALADGGNVVLGVDAFARESKPIFIRLNDALELQTPVYQPAVQQDYYRFHLGQARQYVVSFSRYAQNARIYAYDGDADQELWQRDLSLPPAPFAGSSSQCETAHVTRDDALVCMTFDGAVEVLSADGESTVFTDAALDYYSGLVDGDQGMVVQVDDSDDLPFERLIRLDVASGSVTDVPVDFEAELREGQRAQALGLAIDGDTAVVSGAIRDDSCRIDPDCFRLDDETLGYFLARIQTETGVVTEFVNYSLESPPSGGVGRIHGDSVTFLHGNPLTRHNLSTLVEIDRQLLPSGVEDVNDSTVLIRKSFGEPFTQGYRLTLLAR